MPIYITAVLLSSSFSTVYSLQNILLVLTMLYQVDDPHTYTSRLRTILHAVVKKDHGKPPTIETQPATDGNFITYISAKDLHQEYRSAGIPTKHEAETDAIYQFLRGKTNILGCNIVDTNYPTLVRIVSEINKQNTEINELLLCSTKAATMIHQVHKDIEQMHKDLIQQKCLPKKLCT